MLARFSEGWHDFRPELRELLLRVWLPITREAHRADAADKGGLSGARRNDDSRSGPSVLHDEGDEHVAG